MRDVEKFLRCEPTVYYMHFFPYMPFKQSSNKDVTNSEIRATARWLTFPAHLLFGANWIDKIRSVQQNVLLNNIFHSWLYKSMPTFIGIRGYFIAI